MPACRQKVELIEKVQQAMSELVELMQRSRELVHSVGTATENTLRELDKQIELKFGEKERAMGALEHHQHEHEC